MKHMQDKMNSARSDGLNMQENSEARVEEAMRTYVTLCVVNTVIV